MRYIHGVFVLLLLLCLQSFAADWPQFLGPNRTGFSPETGINKSWGAKAPKVLWQVPMGDRGYAGPSVAGNVLYVVDHAGDQDIVRALSLTSGKKIWEYRYKDAAGNNYGFARSTPTVAGGKIYTVSRLGLVLCLDAKSGKKLWSRSLVKDLRGRKPIWDYSMSVLIDGKKAIVVPGASNGTVAALDAATGRTLWQGGGNDIPGYATPVIATINKVRQYVVFAGKSLIGVDPNSGKLLWSCPWVTSNDVNAAAPIVSGNQIFITSDYGKGCALVEVTGKTAKIKWQNRSIQSHFSTPVLSNGFLYSTSDPNKLVCMEFATGKVRWEQRGFEKGGLMAVDGVLLAFEGASGNLVMVKMAPDKYQELGRFRPLGGQSWTAPIVANGKLIIRNQKTLACLALK
ncbi:MAG: outer membrane protein assembly factor BamB family protein [Armatimonadota bacterium]